MAEAQTSTPETTTPEPAIATSRRRPLLIGLALAVLVLGGLWWAYDDVIASKTVSTDNAYVGADSAQVTPVIGGQIVELNVIETQTVKKGDVLFVLGDSDQNVALAKAEADLAAARRQYRQAVAQVSAQDAQATTQAAAIGEARANLSAARAQQGKAAADYRRRASLSGSGAVSAEEVSTAKAAMDAATAQTALAEASLQKAQAAVVGANRSTAASAALVAGTTVDTSPMVQQAEAALKAAQLNMERTVVRAPMDGVIAKLSVQVGQQIAPGMVTMTIVPLDKVYVDANFKESQLGEVKPGQKATLVSDLYGDDVVFHGTVVGFSGLTGAAGAIIPAQNATGNWIKVVQRVPVRIALDPKELRAHPLRVGLSMEAEIDVATTPATKAGAKP